VFRLFVSTTARFCEARGVASAFAFAADYVRAMPWAPRWTALIDRLCQRRFGTAAPLGLIQAGLIRGGPGRPDGVSHARRIFRLRAHYDFVDSYFTDTVAARMVFERALPLAVAVGESGSLYQLDVMTAEPRMRAEGELVLALSHAGGLMAALPFRFGYCGGNRLALRLGRMHVAAQAEDLETDLYGLPVRAALVDGVYALVRVLGVTELTAAFDDSDAFWSDCGAVHASGDRFHLPLEAHFWHSEAGRAVLGAAWVPQQTMRAELMAQANAAVASWLRYDEAAARRVYRPAIAATPTK
jgi:hypothetical protein